MMIKRILAIFGILMMLVFSACEEDVNYDGFAEEEERYFNLYMKANYPDLEPRESGLYYIEYQEGDGASPVDSNYVIVNYVAYTIPNEQVVDTYVEEWAREYSIYSSDVLYGPHKYKFGTELEGMHEGISLMKEGGISRIIFKSDLGYGEEELGKIGKFESLMYDIELLEVIADPAAHEQAKIDAYLAERTGFLPIHDDETGATMYYIPDVAGDSILVQDGMVCEVYYTGTLLDGREFDSNIGDANGFNVTIGGDDVIDGWDLGLKYFKYGGTGQLLIPHELAYGEDGDVSGSTNRTRIPPYEALLFDIEVTKKPSGVDD